MFVSLLRYSIRFTPRSISSTYGCLMLSAIVFCILTGATSGWRVGAALDAVVRGLLAAAAFFLPDVCLPVKPNSFATAFRVAMGER
jgi:hypothetical protein